MSKTFQQKITFSDVIKRISMRCCIICEKDLDTNLKYDWSIPLCKIHRMAYLQEEFYP